MITAAHVLLVCASCRVRDLTAALVAAKPGTTIVVNGGTYRGSFDISKPVTIEGQANATLQAIEGRTILTIRSADVVIRHLHLVGSHTGDDNGEVAAIILRAARAAIVDDRFDDNTYAISMFSSPNSIVRGNVITGTQARDSRGDAIRVLSSRGVHIVDNAIVHDRDVFVSFSPDMEFKGNHVSDGRYGLHDMYSDRMSVRMNTFEGCEIGSNFMYAANLTIRQNLFLHNRGPAGYGVGMEDVDGSSIADNAFIDNHVGLNLVQSPTRPTMPNRITGNTFTYNGTGLAAEAVTSSTLVALNAFRDNIEQVSASGGPTLSGITWYDAHKGNYWSDYGGYAGAHDVGAIPYRPLRPFESFMDAHPELALFNYSPLAAALDFAARAVPAVAVPPKVVDPYPLLTPPAPALTPSLASPRRSFAVSVLALAALAPLALILGARRGRRRVMHPKPVVVDTGTLPLSVVDLTKHYSNGRGISNVSLHVQAGEAVALWGPNGAGKTTLLRCVLGLTAYAGELRVHDRRPSLQAKAARSRIGYVPQALPRVDMSADELMELVRKLRGASHEQARAALRKVGLESVGPTAISDLSGGMKQRLALACGLVGEPQLLVLDEPSAGLDRATRLDMLALLNEEKRAGTSILFSSHLTDDVRRLADRVAYLHDGRLVEMVAVQDFVDNEGLTA